MPIVTIQGKGRSVTTGQGLLSALMRLDGIARSETTGKSLAIGFINEDFLFSLRGLLPFGVMWSRDGDTILNSLLRALSYSFTFIVRRAVNLIDEADPRTTTEMLPDWERLLALPDCVPGPTLLEDRRGAAVTRLRGSLSSSIPNLIAAAATIGYTITITTFKPFVAGSAAGDSLTQHPWQFVWQVETPHGSADVLLECILEQRSPRHTSLQFYYWYDVWRVRTPA